MTSAEPQTPFVPVLIASYVEEHSRLSVGFRIILIIPQFILMYLLSILAVLAAIVGWFVALATGRLPGPISRYLARFVSYYTRVTGYFYLLTDTYPPFRFEADYPITVELGAPVKLNRLAVLFRLFLMLPAMLVSGLASAGWSIAAFFIWLIVLVTKKMPRSLFDASVAVLRYGMRLGAFGSMVSTAYPSALFGDPPAPPAAFEPPTPEEPMAAIDEPPPIPGAPPLPTVAPDETPVPSRILVLSQSARRLLILFLVLGLLDWIGTGIYYGKIVGDVVNVNEAANSFVVANRALGVRVASFQQQVPRCNTAPEPFRCAQSAESDLAAALEAYDRTTSGINFPSAVDPEVARLRSATAGFIAAVRALIAAPTEAEYFRLAQALDQSGTAFDRAVQAVLSGLRRVAGA